MKTETVRKFLLEFKRAATAGSGVKIISRPETRPTLARLGMTKANLEQLLLGLSVADYCKGPEPDRDRPGEMWFFGRRIKGEDIYIKLKVAKAGGQSIAKCISFHRAQFPLKYPFR